MAGYIEKGAIRRHELVGPDIWRMEIELPRTARDAKPGQFINIKINDNTKLLRRPISIAGTDPGRGITEIFYRVVGEGTALLSRMRTGDVVDSLGPLGTAFTIPEGHFVGVGGGVGIAPMLFAARRAKAGQMTVAIGGRNKDEVFWKDYFPKNLRQLIVTTDDGSYGIKGFSISVLPELFAKGDVEEVITCGPGIMMRKVAELAEGAGIYCEASLERRMGCGTGGCLACVCDKRDGSGHYKVCKDGPVFDTKEVIL